MDLLYPPLCPSCGVRLGREEKVLCRPCWGRLMSAYPGDWKHLLPHNRGLDCVLTGWFFEDVLQRVIHDLKYRERRSAAEELARRLSVMFGDVIRNLDVDVVVPVPLHPVRLRERGYNQSDLLGRPLAASLGLPWAPRMLKRRRNTPSQTALTVEERLENVHGAFTVHNPGDMKRVLLVDDVVTTGATLSACAAAIRATGGKYVAALTAGTPFLDSHGRAGKAGGV